MTTPFITIRVRPKAKGLLILVDEDGGQWCPHCHGFLLDGVDPRSLEQLRLLHGFIGSLLKNWPSEHPFQPEGASKKAKIKHLRAWLTAAAGCVQPGQLHTWETDEARELTLKVLRDQMAHDRRMGRYGWPKVQDNGVTILYPRSVAIYGPNKMSQTEFGEVVERIFDVAYEKTGIDVSDWKRTRGAKNE